MSEDNFLARWSKRKREVAAEEARSAAENPAAAEAADLAPQAEEEPLDLSFLPKLEDLTPESDIRLFLNKGVPETLRNAALRKMWALDPAIRDYRGEALDYAWDWNTPGGVPGGGDLPEGFDAREMVARIFGDPPSDENLIEHAAARQEPPERVGVADPPLETAPEATAEDPEKPAESCETAQVRSDRAESAQDAAAPKRRRHGGAAPSLSAKSIMS